MTIKQEADPHRYNSELYNHVLRALVNSPNFAAPRIPNFGTSSLQLDTGTPEVLVKKIVDSLHTIVGTYPAEKPTKAHVKRVLVDFETHAYDMLSDVYKCDANVWAYVYGTCVCCFEASDPFNCETPISEMDFAHFMGHRVQAQVGVISNLMGLAMHLGKAQDMGFQHSKQDMMMGCTAVMRLLHLTSNTVVAIHEARALKWDAWPEFDPPKIE